ncbi:TPR repeat-containing protein [Kosakonia oryzendophytica]|uniref:TPR repeat-containing protein n=2 Tax=Kosakonia oryzendophytica TaxID=1005665 RepID=A0A1C4CLL7_9ENTR|nr:TPR repeat-containing protein [Kosakonia oryzendophytica]
MTEKTSPLTQLRVSTALHDLQNASAILRRLLLPVVCMLLPVMPVFAAGDNNTNSKTPDCPSGQVYDSTAKQCVPAKTSQLSDEDKTRYAYHLAKKGEYQAALNLLNTLKNGNTAEAWNYRGYATRKLGRTDEGIGYYQRSLALNPAYAKAREYLGEAWLVKGRPDLAKAQLRTIATLCGHGCEEYRDLQAAIDGHPES